MLFGLIGEGFNIAENIIIIVAFALSITIALVVHEYAHAWMALKQGDPSAKMAGRLSINPKHHIEPLGLLCFCLAGIGWAKPVPVNPFNYRNFKRGNFLVSIAGVTTNLIMGFVFSFGFIMVHLYGDVNSLLTFGFYYFFMLGMVINISLMVFNLLPVPPLDGYNMLRSFTKPNNNFMRMMRENTMIFMILIIMVGVYFIAPVRDFIINAFIDFWEVIL